MMLLMMLLTTATAWAEYNIKFDIGGSGTVEFGGETVENGQTIQDAVGINEDYDITLTPASGYVLSSATFHIKPKVDLPNPMACIMMRNTAGISALMMSSTLLIRTSP